MDINQKKVTMLCNDKKLISFKDSSMIGHGCLAIEVVDKPNPENKSIYLSQIPNKAQELDYKFAYSFDRDQFLKISLPLGSLSSKPDSRTISQARERLIYEKLYQGKKPDDSKYEIQGSRKYRFMFDHPM